jgi:hypothetical protein
LALQGNKTINCAATQNGKIRHVKKCNYMLFVDKLFESRLRRNRRSASSADYIKHKGTAALEYLSSVDAANK